MKFFLLLLAISVGIITSVVTQPISAQESHDLAITSINKQVNGSTTGKVYIFDQNYSLIKILDSPEKPTSGQFSGDVTYKNDKIVLSTPSRAVGDVKSNSGPLSQIGAVSIFDGSTGSLIKTIWNPEPNTLKEQIGGTFGSSVTFSDNKMWVGNNARNIGNTHAAGEVYVFDESTGNLLLKIQNPNPTDAADFGRNLASVDGKVAVSVEGKPVGEIAYAGAVLIYDANTGNLLRTIENPEPTPYSRFGSAIDVSNGMLLVSAPFAVIDGDENVGQVYLYDANTGTLLKAIENPDPDDGDFFGHSVMFAGDRIVIGAIGDGIADEGSVYIYDKSGTLQNTIHSPDKTAKSGLYSNEFGESLGFSDSMLSIGDDNKMVNGIRAGAVYVYDITNGKLVKTIDNPEPETSDAFGYFQDFVGVMEPDSDILSKTMNLQESLTIGDSEEKLKESEPEQLQPTNTNTTSIKSIKWLNENGANYTLGGIGVIRLDDSALNINNTLIDIPSVHVWSDTDPKGIQVDIIETGVDTGVFYADILLSETESAHLQLHVSDGDTMTALFEDKSELKDTVKIISKHLSPLKQLESGTEANEIKCGQGLLLVQKYDDTPACVKPETKQMLIERGWAKPVIRPHHE